MRYTYGLYDDNLYETAGKVHYYVQYSKSKEGEIPEPVLQCPQTLDWMMVLMISVGSGCGLFALGFITYFVVINVKDYLEVRAFRKMQKEAWEGGGEVKDANMRKSDKRKSLRNRMSVKFFQ